MTSQAPRLDLESAPNHELSRVELEQKLVRLEHKLLAKDKTIASLIARIEGRPSERATSFQITEQNVALEHVVSNKTSELQEQKLQLTEALDELRHTQAKLLQGQKLKAIGQLAAGIAHEVNTPTQYVSDNMAFLQRAFGSLIGALELSMTVCEASKRGPVPEELLSATTAELAKLKLPYLLEQVPRAIEQSVEGLGRVSSIVQAMKEFSHPSGAEKEAVNIHEAIASTVTIARNEWKYVAQLEIDFDHRLSHVPVLRNEFNQVILNLIVNAVLHAIAESRADGKSGLGHIRISTQKDGAQVEIRVSDDGNGIPEPIRARVFEPFFTTKPVGKGTGQGLAISYSVIVDKHRGSIGFESEEGKGTTFVIRLPLDAQASNESERTGERET